MEKTQLKQSYSDILNTFLMQAHILSPFPTQGARGSTQLQQVKVLNAEKTPWNHSSPLTYGKGF